MKGKGSLSGWGELEKLGEGGNGVVWRAVRDGHTYAIKVLSNTEEDSESYRRFIDEITVLRLLEGQRGVLPILDAHLPSAPSKADRAWLAMPIATGIRQALRERPLITTVVEATASLAGTLAELADKGISHRDIKPENLFCLDGEWVIGDFGLAEFPGKSDITEHGRALGPRFYIAPEMVLDPVGASGFPADVWSLAKTLWVLATGQNFPPPYPQLATDANDALASWVDHPRLHYLDKLIERATSRTAGERPSMREFATELRSWLALGNEPVPIGDVSDLTAAIQGLSVGYFDTESRLRQCREDAKTLTSRLMDDLKDVADKLSRMGLAHGGPAENGVNLRDSSGFQNAPHGDTGVTVWMYTPSPRTLIYNCGILIQVLDDRHHRLYAAHRIEHRHREYEIVWSENYMVEAGTSHAEHMASHLVAGLYDNLPRGLERFRQVMVASAAQPAERR